MKNSKLLSLFAVLLCLSVSVKAQRVIDIHTTIEQTQVCADIRLNLNTDLVDKIIISDGEEREEALHTDQTTLTWCYERKLNDQIKSIEIYAVTSDEIRRIVSPQSSSIVIIDGM